MKQINIFRRNMSLMIVTSSLMNIKSLAYSAECNFTPDNGLPFLRGVNFTGISHEIGSQEPSLNASDYFLKQKKMNVVRLNITWEWIQPRMWGSLDLNACEIVDRQLNHVIAAGGYMIIELHNYGRRNVDGVSHIIGESKIVGSPEFADVWNRISQRWGRNSKVIFALMNEPHDQNTDVLVDVSNAAISSIRRTGANNLVMVSGNGWNSMGWDKGSENQSKMLKIKDERNNFCFDVHHYFDNWSQGQTPNVRPDPIKSMLSFTEWAKANNRRGFCGEFACHVNKKGMDACRNLLKHIEENKDVYLGWAWWGAGGPWQPDYIYLLDPFASYRSATNPDPDGSTTWYRPVDRPQMKVLQEFLPSCATPFNAWLIEDNLSDSVAAIYRRGDFSLTSSNTFVNGMQVTGQWLNSGRSNASAYSTGNPPQLQSGGGLSFSSKNSFLQAKIKRGDSSESIFAVVSISNSNIQSSQTIFGSAVNGLSNGPRLGFSESRELKSGLHADEKNICSFTPRLSTEKYTLIQSTRKTDAKSNSVQISFGVAALPSATSNKLKWSNAGWPVDSISLIGAKDFFGGEAFDGVLHDLVIFNKELSSENIDRVQGRLFWDSGIAHKLPSNHPYRIRPPSIS